MMTNKRNRIEQNKIKRDRIEKAKGGKIFSNMSSFKAISDLRRQKLKIRSVYLKRREQLQRLKYKHRHATSDANAFTANQDLIVFHFDDYRNGVADLSHAVAWLDEVPWQKFFKQ